MDLYHIWCDLRPGISDVEFTDSIHSYLGSLVDSGGIASFRVSRRKLGLGIPQLGEFHICIECHNLGQLDEAFHQVSSRTQPLESLHASVNQAAMNLTFALYRDFPDPQRQRGEEQF